MLVVFDRDFSQVHLHKDVGMIPEYLAAETGFECELVYGLNGGRRLEKKRGMTKLTGIPRSRIPGYIRSKAAQADVLMLYHPVKRSFYYREIYKKANPDGTAYLKLDAAHYFCRDSLIMKSAADEKLFNGKQSLIGLLKKFNRRMIYRYFLSNLTAFDMITAESKSFCDILNECYPGTDIRYLPNGFDCAQPGLPIPLPFEKKEKIIMTCGRIGAPQKNNGMLLRAAAGLDLKEWKIIFVGPVEIPFQKEIERFRMENPHLQNNVVFAGMVADRAVLYEFYNKSRVFCLTSEYEGFPLVFPEALYYGNYIVSTKVGAEEDITDSGKHGRTITGGAEELRGVLQEIIDGKNEIESNYPARLEYCRQNFLWNDIVKKLYGYFGDARGKNE